MHVPATVPTTTHMLDWLIGKHMNEGGLPTVAESNY